MNLLLLIVYKEKFLEFAKQYSETIGRLNMLSLR